jgi:hypothetical protein
MGGIKRMALEFDGFRSWRAPEFFALATDKIGNWTAEPVF